MRITTTLVLSIGLSLTLSAADLYVATAGNDSNPGTDLDPFATIQQAADVANPGDTIIIRAGTYREEVTITRSGTAADPIVIRPETGAQVIVSGLDPVTPGSGGTGTWQTVSGSIYKIQLPSGSPVNYGETIVMIDGAVQGEARWPNGTQAVDFNWKNMASPDAATVDTGSGGTQTPFSGNDFFTATYTTTGFPFTAAQLSGALINLSAAQGVTVDTGALIGVSGDTLTFRYPYNPVFPAAAKDPFVLWNNLDLLDVEGEAFLDQLGVDGPADTLYIWNPAGAAPDARSVEYRARRYGLVFDGCSHVQIRDLSTVAAGVIFNETSSNCTVDGINSEYAGFGMNNNIGIGDVVLIKGSSNSLLNSIVQHSFGGGVQIEGIDNTVDNNVINNVGPYSIRTWFNEGATVNRNTLSNNAGRNIQINGASSTFTRNHCYRAGHLLTDQAIINSIYRDDSLDSEIAYNWAHSNLARNDGGQWLGGSGIRIAGAASNVRVHHNIVWNHTNISSFKLRAVSQGYPNYGDSKVRVYNNTFQQDASAQKSERSGIPSDITGLDYRNNINNKFTNDGAPNFADSMVQNNVFLQLLVATEIPGNPLGGMNFVSGATGNFHPAGDSPLLNTGQLIPPFTDGFHGAAPELGALEYVSENGKQWTAGATVRASHLGGLAIDPLTSPTGLTTYRLSGLPPGRVLPDAFQLKIGSAAGSSDFRMEFNTATNQATAYFTVNTSGLTGSQPVSWSLDGTGFVDSGKTVTVPSAGGFTLSSVAPPTADPAGGSTHTITGSGFAGSGSGFTLPIKINHSQQTDLNDLPVACVVNTRAPIAAGNMKADGGDIRLNRWEANADLDYWVESGLGGDSTVIWVKHRDNLLENRFSHRDESTIYLTYGDPALTSESNRSLVSSDYTFMDHPNLVLWLSANSLGSMTDGAAVANWPDLSSRGNHGLQAASANQPAFKTDQWNGLPAVNFNGSQWTVPGDLATGSPSNMTYLVYWRDATGADPTRRVLSSEGPTGAENFSSTTGGTTNWNTKSLQRSGKYLLDFTVGRRANGGLNFSGDVVEVVFFDSNLPVGNPTAEFDGMRDYMQRKYGVDGTFNSRGIGRSSATVGTPVVTVGSTAATGVSVLSSTQLQFTAPAGPAGTTQPILVQIGSNSQTLTPGLNFTGGSGTFNYALWAASFTPEVGPAMGNSDTDPTINLLEYVQDRNGIVSDASQAPTLRFRPGGSPAFVLRFRENTRMTDASILIQTSTDLQAWTTPQPHSAFGSIVADADPDGDGSARVIEVLFQANSPTLYVRLSTSLTSSP